MKRYQKHVTAFALIVTLSFTFSCDDFLEEEPLDTLTVDQLYQSDEDLTGAIAGVYSKLSTDPLYRRGRFQFFLEFRTDAMQLGSTRQAGVDFEIATFTYGPDNDRIIQAWERLYEGINNANLVLEKAPDASQATVATKKRVLAEAHFLRAFYYFNLVRLWGGVPIVLESPKTYEETRQTSRASVEEVYAQIIADAKASAGETNPDIALPTTAGNTGRVVQSAAHTLLADVYLTRENYSESARYSKLVIDGGLHALWENYSDAFALPLQYQANDAPNGEGVFEIKFNPDVDPGSRFSNFAWPRGLVQPYSARPNRTGAGFYEVAQESYDKLNEDDIRTGYMFPQTYVLGAGNETIVEVAEDTIKGGAYDGLAFNQEPPYFCLKYPSDDPEDRFGWSNNPWPVYRYADVLLMHLEAVNEQGTAPQAVVDQTINQTRARGGLPALTGLGQAELRQAIKDERYVEFFYEGKRFFDLVRWGELVTTVNNRGDFYGGTTITINENYELLPIPQREFDTNPNLGQNNTPWN